VRTFVVEKLLAARMTDAVVSHENDEGIIQDPFILEPLADLAYVFIRKSHGIEVRRPIAQYHRIARIIWGQHDSRRFGRATKFLCRAF
jgi:hypothetical protein